MTDNRQKVLQQIDANKDKSLKFLQKIVSIPSVTGDEGAIQKFLADYLTKMGLEVDMWETDWEALKKHPGYIPVDRGYEGRPNIVATWKGTGGGKSLLFNGHTDVIPVGIKIEHRRVQRGLVTVQMFDKGTDATEIFE